MKKIFLVFLPLFLTAESNVKCSTCSLNRSEMKCNYYVIQKGDVSKIDYCKKYAKYLNDTKVYGKAAWYYLLSKEPKKAINAANEAIKIKEFYAYEYLGDAYLIEGDKKKAKENYEKFKKSIKNSEFFIKRNFKVLDRLYKEFNEKEARESF